MTNLTVLILGGYGTFGGRLARLLSGDSRLTVIIAGRSEARAAAFCRGVHAAQALVPLRLDRAAPLAAQVGGVRPDLLVDASGPFQSYGDDPYAVVKACIALGINYLDLADATDFVMGIKAFDVAARERGVFVLSGASTCPVLTTAAVRHLARDLRQVRSVYAGIAPSPHAELGLSVVRAIAGYAGRPVTLLRDGKTRRPCALIDAMRFTIAPPGQAPLRNRRFTLVDVPDLQVLPVLWPYLRTVWMGVGTLPAFLQQMLGGLAWLVRLRLFPTLAPLARLFHASSHLLRWGERRGGMFVSITGQDADGRDRALSWHLIADGADGPNIPAMAAQGLIRRILDGSPPAPGARTAAGALDMADYQALFAPHAIHAGVRDDGPDRTAPLFQRLLGPDWDALPPALRHGHAAPLKLSGLSCVERGRSPLAWLAAKLAGLPPAGTCVPTQVTMAATPDGEVWERQFGEHRFQSQMRAGTGRDARLLEERFGSLRFALALVWDGSRLRFVPRGWRLSGLKLPTFLAPTTTASEYQAEGRFHFDVEIRHILAGRIVRYRGWLEPATGAD